MVDNIESFSPGYIDGPDNILEEFDFHGLPDLPQKLKDHLSKLEISNARGWGPVTVDIKEVLITDIYYLFLQATTKLDDADASQVVFYYRLRSKNTTTVKVVGGTLYEYYGPVIELKALDENGNTLFSNSDRTWNWFCNEDKNSLWEFKFDLNKIDSLHRIGFTPRGGGFWNC